MKHTISHDLGLELAQKVAAAAFASYQQKYAKYDPQVRWQGDSRAEITFKVKLVKLKGEIDVSAECIEMDLDVPLMLRIFKDKAIRAIDREVRAWIEKAKAGEL